MNFFKKIKDKVTEQVSKVSEQVEKATTQFTEAVKQATSALGFDKIKQGLSKTRNSLVDNLKALLGGGRKIDDALIDEIEEILILSDIGVATTEKIIETLRKRVKREGYENAEDLYVLLKQEILNLLVESPSAKNDAIYEIPDENTPWVIIVVGVNGVGKTTTIGKLAYNYKSAGKSVVIGAADTFRAAANEQLEIWAERAGVEIIQQQQGADPAAVAFDTLKSAISKKKDVVIIDTAGRLHNKGHLMAELEKISRVVKKLKPDAPNDVYLILDATTGQNAIQQAKEFSKVANITGIVLTKLDGTAKGGVVIPIANELNIPVRYIGVGEKIDDLQPFDPKAFVDALFEDRATNEENIQE
ncbi:MAG: signal recognition particle-docking protein FtsY [Ignavibacteria bacterium]|nr:signal recognition particle-docking protein FtsY [Ignavibacteria bacterium]